MAKLKQVISAVLSEIEGALGENKKVETRRITLSLDISILEKEGLEIVAENAGNKLSESAGNRLTIELKVQKPDRKRDNREAEARYQREDPPQAEQKENIAEVFMKIFGAPGFDSSARAAVFHEALCGLSDPQAKEVFESIMASKPLDQAPDEAKKARHFAGNVLKSGPLGSLQKGGELLVNLLRHHSVAQILEVIEAEWKTGEHWLKEGVKRREKS